MFISAVFLWYSLVAPIKKKFTYFQRLLWLGLLTIANSALSALIIFNTQAKYIYVKINQGLLLDAIIRSKNWWFNYVDYRQYDVFNDSSNYTVCIF